MRVALRDIKVCPTKGYASEHIAPQPSLSACSPLHSITVLTN